MIDRRKNFKSTTKTCTIGGCEKGLYALGLCSKHYERQRRRGIKTIDRDEARALWNAGTHDVNEIAAHFGVTPVKAAEALFTVAA